MVLSQAANHFAKRTVLAAICVLTFFAIKLKHAFFNKIYISSFQQFHYKNDLWCRAATLLCFRNHAWLAMQPCTISDEVVNSMINSELPSAATETQLEFIDVSLIGANHRSDLQMVQQPICISSIVSQSAETGTVSGDEALNCPKSGLADGGTEVTMPPSQQQLQPMTTPVAPSCDVLPTFPPDNAAGMMMMMTMLEAFTQQQQQQQPGVASAASVEGLWWTFN